MEELTIDEYMADVGVDMLHPGGLNSTQLLMKHCHVSREKRILDIGCGYGKTACYIAEKFDCQITGIDISEKMIQGAKEKAQKNHLDDLVDFKVMNGQDLQFTKESYDIILSEGTTVFLNKKEAMNSFRRVLKPNGYLGLTELTWMKPPSQEVLSKTKEILHDVEPLQYDDWIQNMTNAGFTIIHSEKHPYKSFSWDNIHGIGIVGLLKVGFEYLDNQEVRRWIQRQEDLFKEYAEYWGYGTYIGRKINED